MKTKAMALLVAAVEGGFPVERGEKARPEADPTRLKPTKAKRDPVPQGTLAFAVGTYWAGRWGSSFWRKQLGGVDGGMGVSRSSQRKPDRDNRPKWSQGLGQQNPGTGASTTLPTPKKS